MKRILLALTFLASALGAEDPVYLDYGHFVSAHPTENKIVRLKRYSVYVEDLDSGEVTEVIQAQNRRIQVAGWTKDGTQMLVVISDPITPRDKWDADFWLMRSSDIIDGHDEKGYAYLIDVSEFPIVTKYGDWSWGKLIASYEHGTDGFSIGPKGEYFLWDLTGPPYAPPYDDYYPEDFLPVMTLVDPTGERMRTSSDPKLAFHSGGMHFSGNGEVILNATNGGITIANLKLKKQNKVVPEGSGVEWAALSHDGQRIAYVTVEGRGWNWEDRKPGKTTIYLLDAAKPGKRKLYSSDRVFVSKPAFSTDGSTLYFVQEVVDDTRGYISGKNKREGRKIYSIALD